jgi:hypothetical protein
LLDPDFGWLVNITCAKLRPQYVINQIMFNLQTLPILGALQKKKIFAG